MRCNFCASLLQQNDLYCSYCEVYFTNKNKQLIYKYISSNEKVNYSPSFCDKCAPKRKTYFVRNFSDYLKKLQLCSRCENRNVFFLKDEYYRDLVENHIQLHKNKHSLFIHFCISVLCYLWNYSIFMVMLYPIVMYRIKSDNIFDYILKTVFLLIIWIYFGQNNLFFLFLYFLQLIALMKNNKCIFKAGFDEAILVDKIKKLKI